MMGISQKEGWKNVQLSNQHCPWFSTKPSDLMQWSMEDLRLDLTWGGELSFLSMVQDLFVSNFRPKLLRFRSTSSYGFSFSVEKTYSCLTKMTLKPQANVWREGLTLTKGMNKGQQRVPGAQLVLDIAAQERSESKRWVRGHAQMAGVIFFFLSPVTVSTEPTAHLKLLDTTRLVSHRPGMLNSLLWKTRRRFTFSGRDCVDRDLFFYLAIVVTFFTNWNVKTCLMRLIKYNDNATVAFFTAVCIWWSQ